VKQSHRAGGNPQEIATAMPRNDEVFFGGDSVNELPNLYSNDGVFLDLGYSF